MDKKRCANNRIKSIAEIIRIAEKAHATHKKIVFTNGCFDLVHAGHIKYLQWARRQGNILIVGINSDESVRKLKGTMRPIIPERERALMIASLRAVSYVLIFRTDSPIPLFKKIRPDVYVKGGATDTPIFQREKRMIEDLSGITLLAPQTQGWSTTGIVEEVLKRYSPQKKN